MKRTYLDEIDLEAERIFGRRSYKHRHVHMRNGLKSEHGKTEFDKLFKKEHDATTPDEHRANASCVFPWAKGR